MSTNYDQLLSLDDVNFTETDADIILQKLIDDYQKAANRVLYPGDPIRLFLFTLANRQAHERAVYNDAGRQNLLRYARSEKLDHIGVLMGAFRIGNEYARTIFKFSLPAILSFDVVIPKGTRGTQKNGNVIFETDEESIITAGELFVLVPATSLTAGKQFNDIGIDEINTIVDPVAYVTELVNTEPSSGGADTENDENYRERIALAPESFSTAGTELGYKYHALSAHEEIGAVEVDSPEPGIVQVIILLKNGVVPAAESAEIKAVKKALNDEKTRPLTDTVDVVPAQAVLEDYTITWYLPQSTSALQSTVANKIHDAVFDYEFWQRSTIGRDINPDELIARCKAAGAKRIELNGLVFKQINKNQVCQFKDNANRIIFGGTERSN